MPNNITNLSNKLAILKPLLDLAVTVINIMTINGNIINNHPRTITALVTGDGI